MRALKFLLRRPTYPYSNESGELYVPSTKELLSSFLTNSNIFQDKRNWLQVMSQLGTLLLIIPAIIFVTQYWDLKIFLLCIPYTLLVKNIHGTAYLHRFCSHKAFEVKNKFFLMIFRNLTVKVIPEEVFAISHHVHHALSDKPGDPYNTFAGWLYCYLADVNHQAIARDLSENEYAGVRKMMAHTGIKLNSFEQYQKWGSLAHPVRTILHYTLNWAFWFGTFYLLGGLALATCLFMMSFLFGVFVRNFNYKAHGSGKDKRKVGRDFNKDFAVNIPLAGFTAGEWHSNHHLYPTSARNGFLWWQLDFTYYFIWFFEKIGIITNKKNYTKDFIKTYYLPYIEKRNKGAQQWAIN